MLQVDIIGDIHGCYQELVALTKELGYRWENGLPHHPEKRKLAFIGDLTDRGPQSLQVIEIVYKLVEEEKIGYYVPGNHCNKLYRYLQGRRVQITHGLETTVEELDALTDIKREQIRDQFCLLYENAPLYRILDEGSLVIAHAGIRQEDIGKMNNAIKTFVLYGDITGEKHADGSPVRRDWAKQYNGDATIVYGHTPVKEVRIINKTYNIDTGAVFGGKLSALRYPERTIFSVPSSMEWKPEKFTLFPNDVNETHPSFISYDRE